MIDIDINKLTWDAPNKLDPQFVIIGSEEKGPILEMDLLKKPYVDGKTEFRAIFTGNMAKITMLTKRPQKKKNRRWTKKYFNKYGVVLGAIRFKQDTSSQVATDHPTS
jgi:hypothetical protein